MLRPFLDRKRLVRLNSEEKGFLVFVSHYMWTTEETACVCELGVSDFFSSFSLGCLYARPTFTHCPGSSWKKSSRAPNPNVYYLVARYHMINFYRFFQLTLLLLLLLLLCQCYCCCYQHDDYHHFSKLIVKSAAVFNEQDELSPSFKSSRNAIDPGPLASQ